MIKHKILLGALLVGMQLFSTAYADDHECTNGKLTLTGFASMKAMPDEAVISASVEARDHDVKKAKQKVDDAVNAMFKDIGKAGLTEKDIEAGNVIVSEEFVWVDNKRKSNGYLAIRPVTIKVSDFSRISESVDLLMKSGFNSISDISYRLRDPKEIRTKVREAAVQDAITKAKSITNGFGVKLGKIASISYDSVYQDPGVSRVRLMKNSANVAMMEANSLDNSNVYRPDELDFSDQVHVEWELDQ